MLIDKNIKKILGGGYNVSEVKYMDKTVWSDGKNITIEINNDSRISLTIGGRAYSNGTYPLKLADDEDLIVASSCKLPGRRIVWEGDVPYYDIYSMDMIIRSSDGRQVSNYYSADNNDNEDNYLFGKCIAPFTKFKNGDKLIITAKITHYLKKMY